MKNVDLLFLTETWLTPKVSDATMCPFDYNIIRKDRLSRGVAVLFKNSLKIIQINFSSIININFEYLGIDKSFKRLKLLFFCIYLSPPTICKIYFVCSRHT